MSTKQLDLIEAIRSRRDDGMQRAEDHAEADDPGWTESAATYLRFFARHAAGQPFLVEDAAAIYPYRPANGKAWGPAVRLAVKRGWLTKAGYAPARTSNLSPKCTWRATDTERESCR
jgi:hypothetical protein